MIIPDANVLIYAHDQTAVAHRSARRWWEATLSGSEPVGIPWVVALAFVRLMTHPTLSENPMTIEQARGCVEGWLTQPGCRLLPVGSATLQLFFELLTCAGIGGNLCTDALIAASAKEHGGTIYSTDQDFDRFPEVRWKNPLRG